jgi:hypothetical protein
MPSTPVIRNHHSGDAPPLPSKFVPRSAVAADPEHSTLQLAAFLRTTGPNEPPIAPITLGGRDLGEKAMANSIHSNGESSTAGLLKYQSLQSQRYPPSPSIHETDGDGDAEDDFDDLELSMYPGARRKRKIQPKEESIVEFLRNTSPPDNILPPSPTTPKTVRDKFGNGVGKKMGRSTVTSDNRGKGVDLGNAARYNPRAMSPVPSQAIGPSTLERRPSNSFRQLTVNVPSSSFLETVDIFRDAERNMVSRQTDRFDDLDEIQSVQTLPRRGVARDPTMQRSQTDSLADFLRNTGPPEITPPQVVKKAKSGFFKRIFGGGNERSPSKLQRSESSSGRYTPITIPAMVRN